MKIKIHVLEMISLVNYCDDDDDDDDAIDDFLVHTDNFVG